MEWDCAHLVHRPPIGLLYQPWIIDDECGTVGGMRIGLGSRSTWRKPAPVPLCPPRIPHDVTWAWTWAIAVGSPRLTAWAMARPTTHFVIYLHDCCLLWLPVLGKSESKINKSCLCVNQLEVNTFSGRNLGSRTLSFLFSSKCCLNPMNTFVPTSAGRLLAFAFFCGLCPCYAITPYADDTLPWTVNTCLYSTPFWRSFI
jgi:hypothetical protein